MGRIIIPTEKSGTRNQGDPLRRQIYPSPVPLEYRQGETRKEGKALRNEKNPRVVALTLRLQTVRRDELERGNARSQPGGTGGGANIHRRQANRPQISLANIRTEARVSGS